MALNSRGQFVSVGNLGIRLTGDATQFEKMISRAEKKVLNASKRLETAGKRMTRAITVPLAAIGAVSVKVFADFDDAMTKSTSIMANLTDEVVASMEEQARAISRNGITSAKELADSYFFLASAGLTAEQSIGALAAVEKFAVAGAFDMAKATDLLTDAQSALGLTSKNAEDNLRNMTSLSDVLLKANTLANASAQQFSEALVTKSAAALRLLNKDVVEGVAVLAAFADQGIKGAAAGEKLSIVLRDLQSATLKNEKAWKAMNLRVFDSTGKMLPLADIIESLETKFGRMTDQQKKAAAGMLGFQERSFSAIQTLFGTSEKIRAYEQALRRAGGTTEEVANKQLKSFTSQMKIVKNVITDVAIDIGKVLTPFITKVADKVKVWAEKWRALSAATKKFIIIAAAVAAAAGPILVVFGILSQALISSIVAIAAVGPLILGAVAAAAMFGASALAAFDLWREVTEKGSSIWTKFINGVRIGGKKISTWMQIAWLNVFKLWEVVKFKLEVSWESLFNFVRLKGLDLERAMLRSFKNIAEGFLKILDVASGGVLRPLLAKVLSATDRMVNKALSNMHQKTEDQVANHHATLEAMERKHVSKLGEINKTIDDTNRRDSQDKAAVELEVKNAEKIMGLLGFKVPEITVPDFKLPDLSKITKKSAAESEVDPFKDQAFQQISLRRFALGGVGGLASSPKKEVGVEAKGVETRLDTLIEVTRTNSGAILA